MSRTANDCGVSRADGLVGPWLSLEELSKLEIFRSTKRAFKIKLNTNFGITPAKDEPGIKAAVRREYAPGDIICRAGDYGSTAFLLLEGEASAAVPQNRSPALIAGRRRGAIRRLKSLFR